MKTCISDRVAERIEKHIGLWRVARSTQADCVTAIAVDMGVSEDTAHDWLERYESARAIFDSVGTEVIDTAPAPAIASDDGAVCYCYSEEDLSGACYAPPGLVWGSILAVFLLFVMVAVVCLVRVEL